MIARVLLQGTVKYEQAKLMYGVPSLTIQTGKGSHMQLEFSWGANESQGGLQSADPCETIIRDSL